MWVVYICNLYDSVVVFYFYINNQSHFRFQSYVHALLTSKKFTKKLKTYLPSSILSDKAQTNKLICTLIPFFIILHFRDKYFQKNHN